MSGYDVLWKQRNRSVGGRENCRGIWRRRDNGQRRKKPDEKVSIKAIQDIDGD